MDIAFRIHLQNNSINLLIYFSLLIYFPLLLICWLNTLLLLARTERGSINLFFADFQTRSFYLISFCCHLPIFFQEYFLSFPISFLFDLLFCLYFFSIVDIQEYDFQGVSCFSHRSLHVGCRAVKPRIFTSGIWTT